MLLNQCQQSESTNAALIGEFGSQADRPVRVETGHGSQAQQCALPSDRQLAVRRTEQRSAVRRAHLPDLLAKKSRSTDNCPIFACSFSISRSRASSPSRPTPGSKAPAPCSCSCSSRHRPASGAPRSVAPGRPPSPLLAAPPGQSSPSVLRQSSVSFASSWSAPSINGSAAHPTMPLIPSPGSTSWPPLGTTSGCCRPGWRCSCGCYW